MHFEQISSDMHAVIGGFIGVDYFFSLRRCSKRLRARLTRELAPALWVALGMDWVERARECPDRHAMLYEICAAGNHSAAMWVAEHFRLDKRIDYVRAFFTACLRGHLSVVRWLMGCFMLEDCAQQGICMACICGHLATASWIADRLKGPPHIDARNRYIDAWCGACGRGHLDVAAWMVARFGLTPEDARSNDSYALRAACSEGHLGMAEWLVERFGLTAHDAQACGAALRGALAGGHPLVVQRLGVRFELATKRSKTS